VSTSRDGVKFDFDEDEEVGRNHDAQSVDAVSRIGATSIGEVSLSVASGSHLGGTNSHIVRESTTALAGSITGSSAGHKLEVQADVSETASAVTCVSEKSGNAGQDTASTKALAGSILNYKQVNYDQSTMEDTTSERVRFDNMIYVMDGHKDGDCWYTAPLDQVKYSHKCLGKPFI
jgi:E3 ubiquitin-protein ligase RNF19A